MQWSVSPMSSPVKGADIVKNGPAIILGACRKWITPGALYSNQTAPAWDVYVYTRGIDTDEVPELLVNGQCNAIRRADSGSKCPAYARSKSNLCFLNTSPAARQNTWPNMSISRAAECPLPPACPLSPGLIGGSSRPVSLIRPRARARDVLVSWLRSRSGLPFSTWGAILAGELLFYIGQMDFRRPARNFAHRSFSVLDESRQCSSIRLLPLEGSANFFNWVGLRFLCVSLMLSIDLIYFFICIRYSSYCEGYW